MRKSVLILSVLLALNANANDKTQKTTLSIIDSGTNGNIDWILTSDGKLSITKNATASLGKMTNYTYFERAPWYENRDQITTVEVGNEVTSIGNYAFFDCRNLRSIMISDNVAKIGTFAFYDVKNLGSITIPYSVTDIEAAFTYATGLKNLSIENPLSVITGSPGFRGIALSSIKATAAQLENFLEKGEGTLSADAEGKINVICAGGGCEQVLTAKGYDLNVISFQNIPMSIKSNDGSMSLYMNGKLIGYKGKRIYTIEEANRVAGDKNRVSIRYR